MAGESNVRPLGTLQLCEQHGFRHAVFISWPHEISRRGRDIVNKLAISLQESFQDYPGLKGDGVFLDSNRLAVGYQWDKELRFRLARSAVTVAILVPTYFSSDYCAIEWGITTDLQALRMQNPRRTCFIPIQLISEPPGPPLEVGAIQFEREFAAVFVSGRNFETNSRWRVLVQSIKDQVFDAIREICKTTRDWPREEAIAAARDSFEFTWRASLEPQPDPTFPTMKSVEHR